VPRCQAHRSRASRRRSLSAMRGRPHYRPKCRIRRTFLAARRNARGARFDAEPAIEAARRVPVKHLKIDPLPAALDSDGSKPDHQPPSDPLSARRLGDKKIFKIQVGRAKSRTWGGTRQNRRARRRERRAAPRILPPDGVRLADGSPEAGGAVGKLFVQVGLRVRILLPPAGSLMRT
jgi:hypothetical protein